MPKSLNNYTIRAKLEVENYDRCHAIMLVGKGVNMNPDSV